MSQERKRPNTRVSGHALRHEGRIWDGLAYVGAISGRGVCECGEESEVLPNAAARKRWHKTHKAKIVGLGGGS